MREAAYRAMLRARGTLGAASIKSHVDYVSRAERELGVDADGLDLSDDGLLVLRAELHHAGVTANSIAHRLTALRRYRELP